MTVGEFDRALNAHENLRIMLGDAYVAGDDGLAAFFAREGYFIARDMGDAIQEAVKKG